MEQRKLPNETLIIVLGIFGFICCCFAGIGAIPAGIGYFLATKSEKIYAENPDQYDNLSQIKTGKIIAINCFDYFSFNACAIYICDFH